GSFPVDRTTNLNHGNLCPNGRNQQENHQHRHQVDERHNIYVCVSRSSAAITIVDVSHALILHLIPIGHHKIHQVHATFDHIIDRAADFDLEKAERHNRNDRN